MKREYDDPEDIPVFDSGSSLYSELMELIKELCKVAEAKPFVTN